MSCSSCQIHVDDIGTVFLITLKDCDGNAVDISAVTTKTMFFTLPDGTKIAKTAEFYTDGTDGKIKYTTVAGDLSQAGNWHIQAFVDFGDEEWYSSIEKFKVYRNL